MSAAHVQNNAYALCSTLTCLLESISEKGYWTDPLENWEPILACVAVEVLMDAGLTTEHAWVLKNAGHTAMTLEKPLRWLNSRIRPDGHFGTDFWEACRLAITIEKHSLHNYFPNYVELKKHILETHDTNKITAGDSDWIGPGFLAAAADYFDKISKHAEANALVERLRSMQDSDGKWLGSVTRDGRPIISPVWHTSQVVLTLMRKSQTEHRDSINRALSWIKNNQDGSGRWQDIEQFVIYSTCYAILALVRADVPEHGTISRGIEYLKRSVKPDGRFNDLGGTLMAAIALLAVVEQHIDSDLSVIDHVLTRLALAQVEAAEKNTATAVEETARFKARNEELERKFHNAEFGVTKKQLWYAALFVAVIIPAMNTLFSKGIALLWPPKTEQFDSAIIQKKPPATMQHQPSTEKKGETLP